MSEITNRLMLLAFGCIMLLGILPLFQNIISFDSLFNQYDTNKEITDKLRRNVKNFKNNVENYIKNENLDQKTFIFDINYQNSVIWTNRSMDEIIFSFISYFNNSSIPLMIDVSINSSLQIIRENFFFTSYTLSIQNNTVFLRFF